MTSLAKRLRAVGDCLVVTAFGAASLLPMLRGVEAPEVAEGRKLAAAPEWPHGLAALDAWPAAFEAWFNDHFGLRRELLALNTRVLIDGFGVSPSDQVVLGTEGWLYYTRDGIFADRRGEERLGEAELERWREVLEGRKAWLQQRGVPYVFAVAPNKVTIYPQHLPERHRARPDVPTRLDQIVAHLAARSQFRLIDGRPLLREAAGSEQVYHRTDSHWNEVGAYVMYRAIVRAWGEQGLALTPLQRSAFDVSLYPHLGDLVPLIPRSGMAKEDATFLTPRGGWSARRAELPAEWQQLPKEWGIWEPPVLYGSERGEGVLLGIGDSFQWQMMPLLASHFRRCVFVSSSVVDFEVFRALVEVVKPTAVLEERAERNMKWLPKPHPVDSGKG